MAEAWGLYRRRGVPVRLVRELGWATVREKTLAGELEAAQALAAMPFAACLGLDSAPCDCLTGLVLNRNGGAITLSQALWRAGVRDGPTLRLEMERLRRERKLVFGVAAALSSHRHMLRRWLSMHGIHPERDVQLITVPPPQMAPNLKAGHLDGFCAGEPWNALAISARAGWIAATDLEVDPGHPEKVLMVRRDVAERCSDQHVALLAAVLEACERCSRSEHHDEVARVLARPEYLGVPAETIKRNLAGELDLARSGPRVWPGFSDFYGDDTNEPSLDKAAWVLGLLRNSGLCARPEMLTPALGRQVFRTDLYEQARGKGACCR